MVDASKLVASCDCGRDCGQIFLGNLRLKLGRTRNWSDGVKDRVRRKESILLREKSKDFPKVWVLIKQHPAVFQSPTMKISKLARSLSVSAGSLF